MKKINKYLFGAFAALLTAGLFSCVEEAPEYVPGAADVAGCNGIYFPTQEASGEHTYDPTMEKKITVTISRDSLKSAANPLPEITVPLKATASAEGIFNVPESVKFADGQAEATIDVTFPDAETAVKYDLALNIDGAEYASIYNSTSNYLELSVFCVEWRYFAVKDGKESFSLTEDGATLIHWTQRHWGETAWGYVKYYQVGDVRYAQTVTIGHNYNGEDYFDPGFCGTGPEWTFKWHKDLQNNVGGDIIDLDVNFYYHNSNYDMDVFAYDWRHYWNDINGNYNDDIYEFVAAGGYNPNESYPLSYYDGNGGFIFYVRTYYMPDYPGGWTPPSPDMDGIAEGFTRVDYSIDVEAYETEDGVAPVLFTVGADVASIKYVVAEGELSAKEAGKLVDAIKDTTAVNIQTIAVESADTLIGVSPAASGIYTIVAVSYDAKGAKESAYTSFTFVAAEDKEEYAAVVTVATEPTSAMYEHVGFNNINSFSYFVYGEGLTAAKVGVFKTADVESKGAEAVAASIKKAVDAETLAAINGTGYSTLATGLDALTSYTVVVWATNGYNSTVTTAEYTTDGLPLEPIGVGTFTYAQFFEGDDPNLPFSINPNYENTYAISNWGYGVDFSFTWDKETNKCVVADQYIGYTHSTYGEVWVIELSEYTGSTEGGTSYYDPETDTFHFFVCYYVSAGYFGQGEEVFKLGASGAGAIGRRMIGTQLTKANGGRNHNFKPERDPQTVAFETVQVERPARPGRDSAPVKMEKTMIKF